MSNDPADLGQTGPKLFGTFAGVFTPTLLTILGVIMYLRLPWTVGNAGLLGGIAIILLANGITAATGLSLSSIATNTRLGAGGPYAIISRSLGFEIGGSIGVPLFSVAGAGGRDVHLRLPGGLALDLPRSSGARSSISRSSRSCS